MEQLPELEDLHNLHLLMMKDIDALCCKHNIKYFLMCGSLLGAVRHDGFIPWDDDVDIGFLRPDYERFLTVAQAELDQNMYYIQKEFTKKWPRTYSKIRRNGTTYIEDIVFDCSVHQGIFIDLFPIDNLADSELGRKIQWIAYKIIVNKYSDIFHFDRKFTGKIKHFLCTLVPDALLLHIIKRERDVTSSGVHMFMGAAGVQGNNEFHREDFETAVDHPFENYHFSIPKGWDSVLKTEFKEYRVVPPVETRLAHIHAKYCDLNMDYRTFLHEKGLDKNA